MPDIDDIWDDEEDMLAHPIREVFHIEPEDKGIARAIRQMDREMKTISSRPSNGHPSNPRKRK